MEPLIFKRYLTVSAKNRASLAGKRLSPRSVTHYIDGINKINRTLAEEGFRIRSVYDADTMEDLVAIAEFLKNNETFLEYNKVGNHMYSSALKHYFDFLRDDEKILEKTPEEMDCPLQPKARISRAAPNSYPRDPLKIAMAIRASGHKCQVNPSHETFIAEKDHLQYVEGHHLIPLCYQREFEFSLDNFANIVALCPNCHRLLHHAEMRRREYVFDQLFEMRQQRLIKIGIDASALELRKLIFGRTSA